MIEKGEVGKSQTDVRNFGISRLLEPSKRRHNEEVGVFLLLLLGKKYTLETAHERDLDFFSCSRMTPVVIAQSVFTQRLLSSVK